MRRLFFLLLLSCTMPVWADSLDQLYKVAGWPEQRAHFTDALDAAQQRYQNSLPPAVFQALVNNSNQRFEPKAVDARAAAQLRANLSNPTPALAFFQSPLGRKIVAAELLATRRDQLAKNAKGLPRIQASDTRLLIIGHLAKALPAREAGAEVSLAIAGVAADSLSQMIPGLLGGGQAQGMLDGQRARLMEQIGNDLNNTLLYVYRDLSDPELEEFASFAESAEGQAYYKAALAAIRAGLAVGQNSADLK
ncbi:DUF2059 domain-containing protein [Pseudomonas sp. FFUP_PS_473]|jgi:hypothetical protein|uniref:DUF2059 domain-containing protein n=1 Tax=Pseudomonas TaxID=286 RepID=UPI00081167F6|nr:MULTISPECIES: DUF2059 domain-containing protein [Pseudomonas]ATR81275.1 DUF2059 domain-containing protein [Pseudomonas sp. HLS-6]MBP9961137.1 DUF2059 domain-containing protein [Pseudomonas sp.]PLP88966.1 DUF2059 domain-containing protein [Pseudomonas sp. FFUP_PS_473]WJM97760.1 DUF2059 domain-containing protein [Pseudomonas defluvii]